MVQAGVAVSDLPTPPSSVRLVDSESDAVALAHRLLTPGRRWPVVVVTIASGHDEPFGDPAEIKESVGDLAEVVVMPTSDVSWAFAREMPALTQTYGGAGRVYPVDHAWVADPRRSRLRFAYSAQDRQRVTNQLISDALQAAVAAGLVEPRATPGTRQRYGRVTAVVGSRALVTLDDRDLATVWEELTVPGVPLDRVLTSGQPVAGRYDPVSRRLDLRDELRYVDEAAARVALAEVYRVGDVILADVAAVTDDTVTLRPLPGLPVDVPRTAVTSNPKDTLTGLFTIGEVVACRIAGLVPPALRLDDIDDEDEPRPAPSLLPDGPPWLAVPEPEPRQPPDRSGSTPTDPTAAVASPTVPRAPVSPAVPPAPTRPPTPLDLARRFGAQPGRAARPVDEASHEALRARVAQLDNELAAERATRHSLASELAGLRRRAAYLEAEVAEKTRAIEQLRSRYREADLARQRAVKQLRAAQARVDQPGDEVAFLNPEQQFRHEVYSEWVRRIPASEKADKPLAPYKLGPEFLDSVEHIEGISRAKIVSVAVEVLTGQDQHLAGRDLHQLRTGGPGTPYVTRWDGATCWRVALQRETAAARRLHYWRTRDGYELSRVATHDDYRP